MGARLEPFFDDWLIGSSEGIELRLHQATPREVVLEADRPWEGTDYGLITVFQEGDTYRLYYRGTDREPDTRQR
jgi:hypothetical protein